MSLSLQKCQGEDGEDTNGEDERVMIEDVHDAITDLVELIKTYKNNNTLSKVFASTLFKQRQEEADAMIDRAILRLHVRDCQRLT